jgi:hypothetical protein
VQSNNVRYLRLGVAPFVNGDYARAVAGGNLAHGVENAGFGDGTRAAARFYAPAGIAIAGNSAIITDAGNRRIRRVALPRFRKTEVGFSDNLPVDKQHFEVLYIGASASYFDSVGDDSICGQIEANLDASHRLRRPVRCHQVRIDGPNLQSFHDYITNFVAPRGIDLVLIQMSTYEVQSTDKTGTKSTVQLFPLMREKVQDIVNSLKPSHGRLGLIWAYAGPQVSASEYFVGRELNPAQRDLAYDGYTWHRDTVRPYIDAVKGMDILQYDAFDALNAYERSNGARPLWATIDDVHPNTRLNIYFGKLISDYLLSQPPAAWAPR